MITDDPAEPLEAMVVETRSPNPITTVIAWICLGLAIFLVGGWVWTRWINPSAGGTISRYVNKKGGAVFESPPDGFRVTLPTKGRRSTSPTEFGTSVTVASSPGDGYEFSVTRTPQSEATIGSYESSLNQIAGQLAGQDRASIESQVAPFVLFDDAIKDVVYRRGDTYWRVRLVLLEDRLYTISARSPNSDDKAAGRLIGSFQILGER